MQAGCFLSHRQVTCGAQQESAALALGGAGSKSALTGPGDWESFLRTGEKQNTTPIFREDNNEDLETISTCMKNKKLMGNSQHGLPKWKWSFTSSAVR